VNSGLDRCGSESPVDFQEKGKISLLDSYRDFWFVFWGDAKNEQT